MIQKTNNISFKGIYPMLSMTDVNLEDLEKILPVVKMDDQFPNNDIFLGVTQKKQLLVEVREKDLTSELLCEEVLNSSNDLTTKQLIGLTETISNLKNRYLSLHPEQSYKTYTKQPLSNLSMYEIALTVYNAVQNFNEKFGNKPN